MTIALDPSKIQYETVHQADKVAFYSLSHESSGMGAGGQLNVLAGTPAAPQVSYAAVANPYKRRTLMTMSWSLDNINFYPMNTPIFYYSNAFMEYAWQCLGFAGCSDSTIYFCATSQYQSNQVMYVQFAGDSPT